MHIAFSNGLKLGLLAAAALAIGLTAGCRTDASAPTGGEGTAAPGTGGTEAAAAREMPAAEGFKVEGNEILIGLVASQNGALRPWGQDAEFGARLAIEEVNKAGGINGKQVRLLVQDSNSDAVQGKSAAEKLMGSKVVGLLGEVASGITKQMADVAFETGVPLIAIGATNPDITKGRANVFRVCYTDDLQGPVMAKFAFEELKLRRVAIMTDQSQPYSVGLSKTFGESFKRMGGEIVDEQIYKSGDTQFSSQLTNLKAKTPDGVFLSGYFTEVGPIVKQAVQAGMDNVKFLGGDGWDSKEILNTGGEAIVGSFFCNHYNNLDTRPQVPAFLAKWKAKYGSEPGTTMGALAYDAAMLMVDALKRAESMDSRGLIAALEATEGFAAVSGDITLKGMNGDPPKRAIVVELTKEGQKFAKAYEASEVMN